MKGENDIKNIEIVEDNSNRKGEDTAMSKDEIALNKAKEKEEKALKKAKEKEEKALKKAKEKEEKAAKKAKSKEEKATKEKVAKEKVAKEKAPKPQKADNKKKEKAEHKKTAKKADKKLSKKAKVKAENGETSVAKKESKFNFRLTGKILGIVTGIMVVLVISVLINVLLNMTKLSNNLVEKQLQASAFAVQSHYDSISEFEYKLGSDGSLYKGTTNLIYEKKYMDEFRDSMRAYTALFFNDELKLSSFLDTSVVTLSDEAKKQCEKNGYYFSDDFEVDGFSFYAYYKVYSKDATGNPNGIMLIAVQKRDAREITKSALVTIIATALAIMAIAVVLIVLFVRAITKSIKKSVNDMERVSKGNLNFSVDNSLTGRTDEIGDMANGIQLIINNFKNVVSKIFEASEELSQFTEKYGVSFGRITETMDSVNIAVEEIANGATSQANETQTANDEMNSMGSAIVDASGNVEHLGESSRKMTGYSGQARNTLEELSLITEKTMKSVDAVQNQTNLTNKSALEIQEATELIANIASQTNLLSLNASIEAARAGENGRGFAVVANEIRNLADQSRSSAEKIAAIVNTLISNSNESVETMNDVMNIMRVQNNKLDDTMDMFASLDNEIVSVNEAIDGIKGEMAHINDLKAVVMGSVESLAAIAEENAASTEETSAAMAELSNIIDVCNGETRKLAELAEGLDNSIRTFKL